MERRRITFSGRVQGVGFRATARGVAAGFPITGWVRNQENGTVLLEVQGAADQVEAFLRSLRAKMGRLISGEESASAAPIEQERGFEISR